MASTLHTDAAPGLEPGAASREVPDTESPVGAPSASAALIEDRIPTVVSAAWELELVIAGGVTFALFQLPSSLDAARLWLEPRASGGQMYLVMFGYIYMKFMVYVLLGAFLLNLTARAYWVGLVGLHSVFPRGIVWDRLGAGPASRDVYEKRVESLPSVMARIDNFASVIFSFAFLIVLMVLLSMLVVLLYGGLGWAVNALAFDGRYGMRVFQFFGLVVALPLAAIGIVDKYLGSRWPAESVPGRRLRKALTIASRVNGMSVMGPIFFTLLTNMRRGVMLPVFYLIFVGGLVAAMGEFFVRTGTITSGSPAYVPDDPDTRTVAAAYYESLRDAASASDVPTIQSDVIGEPYVRLFIPYIPPRHDPALLRTCAGVTPLRTTHVHLSTSATDTTRARRAADVALGCLARMHAITLDGAARPELTLRYYAHPVTGRKGMIAYVPTATLAAGPHTLTVMPPPRLPTSRRRGPLLPYEIPFWK